MGFRLLLFVPFILFNVIALAALRRVAEAFLSPARSRAAAKWITLAIFLLNIPLLTFFIRPADRWLRDIPLPVLRVVFYPAAAWMATIIAYFFLSVFSTVCGLLVSVFRWLLGKFGGGFARDSQVETAAAVAHNSGLSRRKFLAAGPGLLLPPIYAVAAYGEYGSLDAIDVSSEYAIPVANLPRALDGLTIVQISDLHVGNYVRERQLQHVTTLVNQLRPDLVVITGDVIDRNMASLPDAVNGLRGICGSIGTYAVLGNHDYYADLSSSAKYNGCVRITRGLESIGIKTLRNEVVHLGSGEERFALMGLDWLSSPGSRDFFNYKPTETRRELKRMLQQTESDVPKILMAHHPDTYIDVPPEIALTLSGHTHGGGQVILANVDGVPIGIATLRFKYLSGLYQKSGTSLYVNRGIGYLGLPIRINCPPEISRFKLVRG